MILQKLSLDKLKFSYKTGGFAILFCVFMMLASISQAVTSPPTLRKACQSGNDVVLFWIPSDDTCGSFTKYIIYARKTTADPYTILDSVLVLNQSSYTHIGGAVPPTWEYFIICENDCSGMPTISSDTIIVDLIPPSNSDPDSVSVDPFTSKIVIGWRKNTTPDLAGYTIYEESGTQTTPIASTSDTSYWLNGYSGKDSVHTFKIAAFDSCGNLSPSVTTHTTMHLLGSLDDCAGTVDLTWTDYKGWPGVQKYDIFVSRNKGPFLPEKTVDGNTLNIGINQVMPGDLIEVFIRAYNSLDNNITSSSNMFMDSIPSVKLPSVNYLSLVTIVDNKYAKIKWITDTNGEISFFKVNRGIDKLNMQTIQEIPFDKNKTEYEFDDKDPKASFDKTVYFYQIEVYDNCKNPSGSFSNISNTIVANIDPINDTQNVIKWNKYEFFNLDVGYYYIYRGLEFDGVYEWKVIGSTKPSDNYFVDLNTPQEAGNTGICYRVDAYENPGNPLTANQEISNSSRSCELKDFKIFFPTAFNPFGVNRKWIPKGSYVNYDKTQVVIYNSWGQYVTTITDIHKGWDGKDDKGEWMPPGSYIYYATITGVNKRKETRKGDFVFLR